MKRSLIALSLIFGVVLIVAACTPTAAPQVIRETVVVTEQVPTSEGVVTVLGTWSGAERDAFTNLVLPFTEETGIGMAFEGTRDLPAVLTTRHAAGNPPDIAIMPNRGQVAEFANLGALVDLSTFLDMDAVLNEYGQSWIDISSINGGLVSGFFKPAYKSLVWYNPKAFADAGYAAPTTWDEMIALSDQIVADGGTPWCVGFESGAASGWPGTDWIEDIMLRTAGPEVYDQWVQHQIPWTDPAVFTAWETFGEIVLNEDYVLGGSTGILTTFFGDSPAGLFTDPSQCFLHKQASFVPVFFPEGVVAGEDYNFFAFPSVDPAFGVPALTSGDFIVMFNDTPEARELIGYLVSAQAQELAAAEWAGFVSANRAVSLDAYPDDQTRQIAEALTSAEVARFDGGDDMPAAVGSGTFWSGVLDYVSGEDLNAVLAAIEASAVDAYGG